MKNVLIYNIVDDKKRYDNELLFNYFRAQVDNSLRFGWKNEDIIIGTNFEFEHNGVKNIELIVVIVYVSYVFCTLKFLI